MKRNILAVLLCSALILTASCENVSDISSEISSSYEKDTSDYSDTVSDDYDSSPVLSKDNPESEIGSRPGTSLDVSESETISKDQPTPTQYVYREPAKYDGVRMSDYLGFVGGPNAKYKFTDEQYTVIEMANVASDLGSKIFKTSLHFGRMDHGDKSLVETAKRDVMRRLFSMDFNTYVLTSHPFLGGDTNKWMDGVTRDMALDIRNEIYELTKYLLTEYKNTGKTFVLQIWEADELLPLNDLPDKVAERRVNAFVDWVNLIQDGVTLAREDYGMQGVWVVFGVETNHVPGARSWDYPVLMDEAFPRTAADLYSASVWSSTEKGTKTKEALDYYASKVPDSYLFGEKNIYYGEFGSKEFSFPDTNGDKGPRSVYDDYTGIPKMEEEKRELLSAIEWGVQFVCFWQVYCNGLLPGISIPEGENAVNRQLMGVWLIRADGSKTPTYDYFQEILSKNDMIQHPQIVSGLSTLF